MFIVQPQSKKNFCLFTNKSKCIYYCVINARVSQRSSCIVILSINPSIQQISKRLLREWLELDGDFFNAFVLNAVSHSNEQIEL